MIERYKIDSKGPDSGGVHTAITKAIELAEKHNFNIVFCVPSLKEVSSTIFSDVLGKPFTKDLVNYSE